MKKVILFVLFLCLGFFASAALSLQVDSNLMTYDPGSVIALAPNHEYTFTLHSSVPFSAPLYLTLDPKTNAYFIPDQTLIPVPWMIYSLDDIDILVIDFPLINPNPTSNVDFNIWFHNPATFAVVDESFMVSETWELTVPEPASLLLLGLGGLALRNRKK